MKTIALAATAAAIAVLATSASAATYADPWTTAPNGNVSVVFGDNGLDIAGAESIAGETTTTHFYDAGTGAFTDTFAFELNDGVIGFTLNSIGFATNSSLTVTSLTFNGVDIPVINTPQAGGGNAVTVAPLGFSAAFPVVQGGQQLLVVNGIGGPDAVFSGTGTFSPPGAVPEPATWGLMIAGFGGAGAMLRRRRERVATA